MNKRRCHTCDKFKLVTVQPKRKRKKGTTEHNTGREVVMRVIKAGMDRKVVGR